MTETAAVLAVREGLIRIARTNAEFVEPTSSCEDHQLRLEVHTAVDEWRIEGWAPERVVIAVKQLALNAGLACAPATFGSRTPMLVRERVARQIVLWAIERYYASSAEQPTR